MHRWARIVGAVLRPRLRAASYLGIGKEELESLGALVALEAELSWEPDGGRSLSSWVYLHVEYAIRRRMAKVAREFADDSLDEWSGNDDPETRVLVAEALDYLQARLSPMDWRLLWLFYGQGYSARELAREFGLSYGTVRNKLSAARKNAMTLLAPSAR